MIFFVSFKRTDIIVRRKFQKLPVFHIKKKEKKKTKQGFTLVF
uniref:Uncharacterized protein n=1 Tax=Anguilla anguilla TaxID=7936 RepID=A0A0E9RRR7_ANGAN